MSVLTANKDINKKAALFLNRLLNQENNLSSVEDNFLWLLANNEQLLDKIHFAPQESRVEYDCYIELNLTVDQAKFSYHEDGVTYYNPRAALDQLKEKNHYVFIMKVIFSDDKLQSSYDEMVSPMLSYCENQVDLPLSDMLLLDSLEEDLKVTFIWSKINESLDNYNETDFVYWTNLLNLHSEKS